MMNVIVTVFWLQDMGFDVVQKLAGLLIRQTVYLHRRNVFPREAQMGLCSDLVPVRGFVYTKGISQPGSVTRSLRLTIVCSSSFCFSSGRSAKARMVSA